MNSLSIAKLGTLGVTLAVLAACSGKGPTDDGSGTAGAPVTEEKAPSGSGSAQTPASGSTPPSSGGATTPPSQPGAGTPGAPGGTPGTPGTPAPGDPGGTPGTPGQAGRISVNEHCCYGGAYYRCPDSAACFGGFDIDACLATCSGPEDPCFDACFTKLDTAGAPKGCQSNVPEPAGVDCKNGQINL